jgi:hypothetical protein
MQGLSDEETYFLLYFLTTKYMYCSSPVHTAETAGSAGLARR